MFEEKSIEEIISEHDPVSSYSVPEVVTEDELEVCNEIAQLSEEREQQERETAAYYPE